jgi:hypothetical protein
MPHLLQTLREDAEGAVHVAGLTPISIATVEEMHAALGAANQLRATAPTQVRVSCELAVKGRASIVTPHCTPSFRRIRARRARMPSAPLALGAPAGSCVSSTWRVANGTSPTRSTRPRESRR